MSFDNVVPFSKQTDWVRKTLKLEYFCRGGTGGCIFEKVLENVIAETEFKLSPPLFLPLGRFSVLYIKTCHDLRVSQLLV